MEYAKASKIFDFLKSYIGQKNNVTNFRVARFIVATDRSHAKQINFDIQTKGLANRPSNFVKESDNVEIFTVYSRNGIDVFEEYEEFVQANNLRI